MPLILGTNSIKDTGYEVANSLRFDDGSSDYLNKTFSGAGSSADLFTFSLWIKRGVISSSDRIVLFYAQSDSQNFDRISLIDTDVLEWKGIRSDSQAFNLTTSQVFRDTSAWYHLHFIWDSADSTADNRMRIYVNGTQVTSFGTRANPSSGLDAIFGSAQQHSVGSTGSSGTYYDGYMCEVVYLDGQEITPDGNTGEFDSDSPTIWKPKDVSGLTFGNNGFYLDFENASSLGADVSGNGNNFTVNNLTSVDQSTDTCTNNFATLNSLVKAPSSITFSEGNLKAVHPGSWTGVPATIGVQSGRWYWEVKATTGNSANAFTGICIEDVNFNDSTVYDETGLILYFVDGRKTVDGTDTESFFSSLATNDIVGVALDLDSGTKTVTFTKNGSASGSAVNLTSNFDNKFIFPVGIGNSSSATANWEFNFGSPSYSISSGNSDANGYGNFEYSVPSGYYALNTKNLAEFG